MKASDPKMDGTELLLQGAKKKIYIKQKSYFIIFEKLLEFRNMVKFLKITASSIYINGVKYLGRNPFFITLLQPLYKNH